MAVRISFDMSMQPTLRQVDMIVNMHWSTRIILGDDRR